MPIAVQPEQRARGPRVRGGAPKPPQNTGSLQEDGERASRGAARTTRAEPPLTELLGRGLRDASLRANFCSSLDKRNLLLSLSGSRRADKGSAHHVPAREISGRSELLKG